MLLLNFSSFYNLHIFYSLSSYFFDLTLPFYIALLFFSVFSYYFTYPSIYNLSPSLQLLSCTAYNCLILFIND